MDLRSLRFFVHIADAASITRAAVQLGIAQPALTRHVQAMESQLGAPLLERLPRGVRLTAAGRKFLEHARRVVRELDRAQAELTHSAQPAGGRVILGVSPTLAAWLVPGCVERCRSEAPELSIKVVEGFSPQLADALGTGRVDVALLTNPQPARALRYTPLLSEPIVVVGPRGAAPARPFFTLAELARTPVLISDGIRAALEEQLARAGARINVEVEIDSIEAIRALLLRGATHALMPVSTFHDDIASGRLSAWQIADASLHRMLVLAQSARPALPAATESLAQIVAAEIEGLFERGTFALPVPPGPGPRRVVHPPISVVQTRPQRRKSA
ncbi:MAG: LysR family transcriptional regulator [Pseudomonadota bacterium]